jgi:hypothetical protein
MFAFALIAVVVVLLVTAPGALRSHRTQTGDCDPTATSRSHHSADVADRDSHTRADRDGSRLRCDFDGTRHEQDPSSCRTTGSLRSHPDRCDDDVPETASH